MAGKKVAKRYTQEEIDYALTVVAIHAGRTQYASDALAKEGIEIPQGTLDNWKHHSDGRYDRTCTEVSNRIAERVAQQAETVVLRAAELEIALMDELEGKLAQLKPSELAGSLKNVTSTKTLNVEKVSSPLRGRATSIVETRDATEILRSLAAKLPPVIEGTAQEIEE